MATSLLPTAFPPAVKALQRGPCRISCSSSSSSSSSSLVELGSGSGSTKGIRIAAVSGSIRHSSTNNGLLRAAMEISKKEFSDVEIELLSIADLPLINTDLENVDGKPFPDSVLEFREQINAADAILFACPEYNYSLSSPMKNAIDWASRPPNAFSDKPAAIISAGGSMGGARAQYHLRQIGVFLNLHFLNSPELYVRSYEPPTKFDANGELVHDETRARLKAVLSALKIWTLRLQQNKNL